MKADLTRNTFDLYQHFARVLMQQGRVQLDADWNEQASIILHYLQTLAADLIGPQGGPTGNLGFEVKVDPTIHDDFFIGQGRYYIDGILCEADTKAIPFAIKSTDAAVVTKALIQVDQWTLDGAAFEVDQRVEIFDDVPDDIPLSAAFSAAVVQISAAEPANLTLTLQGFPKNFKFNKPIAPKLRRAITYLTQPDYPVPAGATLTSNDYLIYLDTWERLITYVEDDRIREVALDGPDTAARSKIVCQVKAVAGKEGKPDKNQTACDVFKPTDTASFANLFDLNRGRLKAMAKQTSTSADPCIIPPDAKYSGPENQLYRVEIHRSGGVWDGTDNGKTSAATFKWSRENGSVVYPIVSISSGSGPTSVKLENLGRDDRFGLTEGEWVEIQDDTYVLQNRAENLFQVQSIDRPSTTVTLNGTPGSNATKHPLLRRWDHQEGDPADGGLQLGGDGGALVVEASGDAWLSLEDGVQIQFQPPDSGQPANQYRTGDYWLIPARTATGDVEWPSEIENDSQGHPVTVRIARAPDGIDHHYAPLAVISINENGISLAGDCRKPFEPLSQLSK